MQPQAFRALDGELPVAGADGFPPEVEARARQILVETIGEEAAEKLLAGGAYPIPSRLFNGVHYLVPCFGAVLVVRQGRVLHRSCLVVKEHVPEADRLTTLIRRILSDETVIYGTGVVS